MPLPAVRDERVIASEVGDEFVLVSADMVFFSLNETARFVWEQLDGVADLPTIADRVTAEFAVDTASAAPAVTTVVDDLCTKGLAHHTPSIRGEG